MQDRNDKSKYSPFIILFLIEFILLIPWGFGYSIFPHGRGGIDTIVFAPFHSYPILVVLAIFVSKITFDKGKSNIAVLVSLFPLFILMVWIPLMFVLLNVAGNTYFYFEGKISNIIENKQKKSKIAKISNQKPHIIEIQEHSFSKENNGSCYLPYKVYKKDGVWEIDYYVVPASFGKSVNYSPECVEKKLEMENLYMEHIVEKTPNQK